MTLVRSLGLLGVRPSRSRAGYSLGPVDSQEDSQDRTKLLPNSRTYLNRENLY